MVVRNKRGFAIKYFEEEDDENQKESTNKKSKQGLKNE